MKYKIIIGLLITACSLQTLAQTKKTISVKSPYTKKVIYTRKKGEKFQADESFISFNTNGARYEFTTVINEKYYLHTNAGIEGPLSYEPWRLDDGRFILYTKAPDSDNYLSYYYDAHKKIKLGPYESVEIPRNYKDNHAVSDKGGFVYGKEKKKYVKIFGQANDLGPYKNVEALKLEKGNVEFFFVNDSVTYVYRNGKITGPFNFYIRNNSQGTTEFTYKDVGGYYAMLNWQKFGPFKERPTFSWTGSKCAIFVREQNGIYPGYFLLDDGTQVPGDDHKKGTCKMIQFADNSWIKLEKTEMIKATKNEKAPSCARNEPWTIFYSNGKSYGPFTMVEYNDRATSSSEAIFCIKDPPEYTCDPTSGKASSKNTASQAYVFSNGEKSEALPGTTNYSKTSIGKTRSGVAFDGKLYIDKKYTGIDNVTDFQFDTGTDDWFATTKSTDTASLYRNGKKIFTETGKGIYMFRPEFYGDNEFSCFYRIDKWYFLKVSNRNKEIGPLNDTPSWRNPLLLSKDKKHIGMIIDYTKINIDGQDKGEGTALSLNETTGSFHWLSIEKENVILHSLNP